MKFRVYSKIDKKYLENLHFIDNDWDLSFKDFWWNSIRYENQDNFIVEYNTWLKDKNWKEIFEGDVLRSDFTKEPSKYIEVKFEKGSFIWQDVQYKTSTHNLTDYLLNKFQVIWNIYEDKI